MQKNRRLILILLCIAILTAVSCTGRSVKYLSRPIPLYTGVAVIIDAPNNIKNEVMTRFLSKGFTVKAINASDFYSMNDIFDIRDFKKVSYIGQDDKLLSLEKTFNNLYKMHFYNYETNKAEILAEMRNKWNIQYLILLEIKPLGRTSWGRAIDLKTNDIVWIENHSTSITDNTEKIVDKFINSMTGNK